MTDWDAVVGQHVEIVRRTVYRLVGNHADAWDCIQETFLEAVKIDRREPVRNWSALLRHLATARALDLLRIRCRQRSRRGPDAEPAQATSREPNPSCSRGGKRARRSITRCRGPTAPPAGPGLLPELLRADGLRRGCPRLGISPNATRMLLSRARRRLQGLLEPLRTAAPEEVLEDLTMENREDFHHDDLLERAVEAGFRDPIPGELPPEQVAQLVAAVRQAADKRRPITLIERIENMKLRTRIAVAAAVLIASVGLISCLIPGSGAALAFDDVAEALNSVQSATWKTTWVVKGTEERDRYVERVGDVPGAVP